MRLGLSQEDLAREAGVDVKTLRDFERGRRTPRLSTVRRVADALGLEDRDRESLCVAVSTSDDRSISPPAQLPLDVSGFVGRATQIDALDKAAAAADRQSTSVVISAVWGAAGVGKTALAVHWAHRVAHRFPDGQLYVNLRGFDPGGPAMDPAAALRRFLDALRVPPERIPADLDGLATLYRMELAGRRMLVVLDNARDSAQVHPLLPGTPTCLVLVTSRNRMTGLVAEAGARAIDLDLLTSVEARQLLAVRLGLDRMAAEPQAVEDIIAACVRLPLALAIVAARAATSPHLSLTVVAGELRGTSSRLSVLTTDDPRIDVRAVFSWSYQVLSDQAARLFRLLAQHPGPDISAAAAASLAALPPEQLPPVLADLTRTHLLIQSSLGRYTIHDLLRAYATEQSERIDPEEQRRAATHRMLDHYLHTAHAAELLLNPTRDTIALAEAQPGVTAEALADSQQALDWFTVEYPVLLAAIDHAAAERDPRTWQLAWALDDFLDRQGHWHEWAAVQRAVLATAEHAQDIPTQARAHANLAHACTRMGRFDDAHTELGHALRLYQQVEDHVGQARTSNSVAYLWAQQNHNTEALGHAEKALNLYQAAGHQSGQALATNLIGWLQVTLGDYQQALASCQKALALHQELGDRSGQAAAWDSLGYAHHHLGHYKEAIACYQSSLALAPDVGDTYEEATTLVQLGDTYHATGDLSNAQDTWHRALTILEDLDHHDAEAVRIKLHGLHMPHPGNEGE